MNAWSRILAMFLLLLCAGPAVAQSPVGEWDWGAGGGVVAIDPAGTGRDSRGNTMAWTTSDPAVPSFELKWSHGYTDVAILSPDGNALEIVNNVGTRFVATRRGPVRSVDSDPTGSWKWGVGAGTVEILADGTGHDSRGNTMAWTTSDPAVPSFELKWSNGYTDIAILSPDGSRLDITNNAGSRFGAERIGAGPAGPLDLNGSWTGGLLHIWQDGAEVLVTATWKRVDGKWVALRGQGTLAGNVVLLDIRYSPMTHGPVAPWQGRLTVSADGNMIEAVYTQGAAVDRRVYHRDR